MKRLILIGGMPWKADNNNNALAHDLRLHRATEVKVAFCNFARTESRWDDKDQNSIEMFDRFAGGKKWIHQTMTSENFRELSAWADIIYMPGGDPDALHDELAKHKDLSKIWDGKIIAGSSAGADVMCASFVFLQLKTFGEGFGWVQAICIPHWRHYPDYEDADWDKLLIEMLQRRPDLPVLCIPEGQFVEITVT